MTSNSFFPELRLETKCLRVLYYSYYQCNKQISRWNNKRTIERDCVLEITIKLRIGSFSQLLLRSILTVFIRMIHTHFIFSSTNPSKLSTIMSLMVQVFDVRVSYWTYSKYTKRSILFSTLINPHRVNTLFLINTHFFNDSICLLTSNHFHLIDQTTMNLFVVFALFCFMHFIVSL